jgi:two-component system, OmpR family, response regulator
MGTMEKTVLIIEDDESLGNSLKDALEGEGFSATVARDGGEGLKQALEGGYGAIVADINLPGITGITILEKVRSTEAGKRQPFIVLTAEDTTDDTLMKLAKFEPTYYLMKDASSVSEVVEKVKESLSHE